MRIPLKTVFSATILVVTVASVATSQPPAEPASREVGAAAVDADYPLGPGPASERGFAGQARGFAGQGVRVLPSSAPAASSGVGAAGDMIGFSHADAAGTQTITLVDTRKSWMAVYHVKSGTIRLVSSRPIDADFSLQLNATSPLPEEIRRIGNR